jgi:glutamine amidotransferase
MCELMALSFDRPVAAGFALREFGPRGEENPDGWGLGWYSDQSLSLFKEPLRWSASHLAGLLERNVSRPGLIYLAHVRHKTMGGTPTHADTHPFSRELGGRDYCFAHNGTLDGPAWDLPLGRFQPLGETDSERFFCHLLGRIDQRGSGLDTSADWQWLQETLAAANGFGKLNVLFSDGQRLFVYHDVNGWKGLNFRECAVTTDHPDRFDGENDKLVASEGIGKGLAIATCPLSPTGWQSFMLGELIVIEAGQIRYSSHRNSL